MEKSFDLGFRGLHPALLEIGLAAAAAAKCCGHFPAKLPQIALPGHQTVGIAGAVAAAEHRRSAAADFPDGIRQFPDSHAVQIRLKMQHITKVYITFCDTQEDLFLQLCDAVFLR